MTFSELENIVGNMNNYKIEENRYKCPYCNHISTKIGIVQHFQMLHTDNGKKLRNKISEGMKKAHAEGRANNWQDSRRKNGVEGSYPEQFFKRVIANEFNDKNYISQYRIGKYALDFAWPAKKLYIEIDGKQHIDNVEYDENRDKFLEQNGWTCLRIFWKDLYNNPKYYIGVAKSFIDNGTIHLDKFFIQKGNIYKVKDCMSLVHRINEKKFSLKIDGFSFDNRYNYDLYVKRKESLKYINIDFSKFGCFVKLGKYWNISGQKASKYYKKYFRNR